MLANLIATLAFTTTIGMTQPRTPPQKSGVITNEVSYQYETNEVNSIDDLIIGNIYHIEALNEYGDNIANISYDYDYPQIEGQMYNVLVKAMYSGARIDETVGVIEEEYNEYKNYGWLNEEGMYIYEEMSYNATEEVYIFTAIDFYYANQNWLISLDLVLNETTKQTLIEYTEDRINNDSQTFENVNWLSKSNYLGQVIVTETETEGLYNTIENFIQTYLYGNDKLQNTEYTIMGVTYSMSEWLAHTTTIVLISLIVFVLVMLIKWLFKQIGNTFNLVGAY